MYIRLAYTGEVISAEKTLPRAMTMDLIKKLQDHVAPEIFGDTRAVFDGRKSLFAPAELKLGGDSREVCTLRSKHYMN